MKTLKDYPAGNNNDNLLPAMVQYSLETFLMGVFSFKF